MNNAVSPKYCDLSGFGRIEPRPPVLWARGSADKVVSDASLLDFGALGGMGYVPCWPGEETFPSQPMVSQRRAVLDEYAAAAVFPARRCSRAAATPRMSRDRKSSAGFSRLYRRRMLVRAWSREARHGTSKTQEAPANVGAVSSGGRI